MLETRNFLIPDATLVIEMVAFTIVLVVMSKFVLPHIREAMVKRQSGIETALAAAREAEQRRERAEQQALDVLAAARRQASEITDRARSMRDHLIAEGRREGNAERAWLAGRGGREAERRAESARLRGQREATGATLDVLHEWVELPVDDARFVTLVERRLAAQAGPTVLRRACQDGSTNGREDPGHVPLRRPAEDAGRHAHHAGGAQR